MFDPPKTQEEASARRYGAWAGNSSGYVYAKRRCAYEVQNGWFRYQCSRLRGHGLAELYCKQHARTVVTAPPVV